MSARLLHIAAAPFEAAAMLPVLPEGHRSRRLHGHSFLARVSALPEQELPALCARLADAVAPLDYRLLNELIEVPSDENLARWVRTRLAPLAPHSVGVQSTRHQGADLGGGEHALLWRRFRFEAAHRLPRVPQGHPCGHMHGHGFEVILHVEEDLGARDMGLDYDQIDLLWQPLHERLDHACLNDIPGLENPTSEMLARWIRDQLHPRLPGLAWVTVHETATAGCHYDGARFRIWKETRFESALALEAAPPGDPRRRLHGHSYVTRLHLSAPLDEVLGWTVDYGDVRAAFTPVFRRLDHARLDTGTVVHPDAGGLLEWMREACAPLLPQLDRIDLFETPLAGASLAWGEEGPALPGLMP